MESQYQFAILNCFLLVGMGIYLTFYILLNEVELQSGLTYIAGTLMGYGIYSTLNYLKLTKNKWCIVYKYIQ